MPATDSLWCDDCLTFLSPSPRCQQCGLSTITALEQCGACLRDPPPWDQLFCIGEYQMPLKPLIQQLKYQRHFWLATDLAALLAKRITEPAPLLVPVPLHWRRQLWRSFNQSELLASDLARFLSVKSANSLFQRTRATLPQQGLNRTARKKNLLAAFKLKTDQLPEHIAIVDDVVTTGSTVGLLSALLKKAGVQRVDIYCICRASDPNAS